MFVSIVTASIGSGRLTGFEIVSVGIDQISLTKVSEESDLVIKKRAKALASVYKN